MQRLRNESSVRTITRELHMAQSVPTVRIRAFKNGEGSRGQGEILIGSSIHAVCLVVLSKKLLFTLNVKKNVESTIDFFL